MSQTTPRGPAVRATITPISTATNTAGRPIGVGAGPTARVIAR